MKKTKNLIKNTMKVGMGSLVGHSVIGSIGSMPGMPAQAAGTANLAHSGLNLVNVGQLGKTGMSIAKDFGGMNRTHKTKCRVLNNILR